MIVELQKPNTTRLSVVDALRGLALFGILIANIPYMPDSTEIYETRNFHIGSSISDEILNTLFHLFIDKKFITIFGILFGFGFYIQMKRTLEKGADFKSYFLIRMLLLLLIGSVHAYFFWFGDIIRYYAICGSLLLFVFHWPVKKILKVALFFNVFLTASVFIINGILGLPDYPYDHSLSTELPVTNSWWRYLKINATIDPMVNFFNDSILTFVFSFGNILLGFWLGKSLFFEQPERFSKYFKPIIYGGIIVGIGASYLFYLLSIGALELTLSLIWLPFVIVAGMVWQSLFYIAAFMKLFNLNYFRKLLSIFVPVGKMALTNYLLQTAFYILIFFHAGGGLKLFGKITLTETYLLAIFLFMLQVMFSKFWLMRFQQGPIEFIWKKVSYRFFK
ncbi:DUF418 domain-containing protein [Pararhodonellum marinum]|uniref:DUF418 domain-containing protein n=1 Tax=Pararhodonellum marinum TaxID=2755358 RepID=UPI00188F2B0C|nr:DUF418 domain-containing protein [Pararhodonellum marinum]